MDSVYIPGNLGEKQDLPVIVWIHGYVPASSIYKKKTTSGLHIYVLRGGYVKGNASQYNGNDLIREAGGGVVAVVIQYRLGLFGFLAGEKIRQEGAVNAGLCKVSLF